MRRQIIQAVAAALGFMGLSSVATADTIDPSSFSATLEVGESVTVRKIVTIEEGVTSALVDVVFLIDTSGSMGSAIAGAKEAAADILTGLAELGDVASGTGYYSEGSGAGYDGVYRTLSTNTATGIQNINDIVLSLGGGGGDFPELGFDGTKSAAEGQPWRTASNRFILALGDATFKETATADEASTVAALEAANIVFAGIDFRNMTRSDFGGSDPTAMAEATGGSIIPSSTSAEEIVDAIVESVRDAFSTYEEVTVSDLGAGSPGLDLSILCVSAAAGGSCDGAMATGEWDRSAARTFEFDVTFTALADGTYTFDTNALVDGGIVAIESDRFTIGEGGPVEPPTPTPEPGTVGLLGMGLLGLAFSRRRRQM